MNITLSLDDMRTLLTNERGVSPKNSPCDATPPCNDIQQKQIVVIVGGWVVVGDCIRREDEVIISKASVIRRWGTTKGLGEIAAGGPTANTILDPCGTARVYIGNILMLIDCNQGAWR